MKTDRQKWLEYEKGKQRLYREDLSPEQYAAAIRALAKRIGL